jgi:hypothetical protein
MIWVVGIEHTIVKVLKVSNVELGRQVVSKEHKIDVLVMIQRVNGTRSHTTCLVRADKSLNLKLKKPVT